MKHARALRGLLSALRTPLPALLLAPLLVAVPSLTWSLNEGRPGDGGFGCVPGSHRAGFPVPPGFVVTTAAYDLALRESGLA